MRKNRLFIFDRKSVAFSWFLSYIAVFFLPIILSIALFWQASMTLEDQVDTVNNVLISNAANTLDDAFRAIFSTASHVIINPSLRVASHLNAPIEGDDYEKLDRAVREIRALVDANDYIRDYYILLRNSDYVIKNSSLYAPENLELMIPINGLLTQAEWTRIQDSPNEGFELLDDGRLLYIKDMLQFGDAAHSVRAIFFLDDTLLLSVVTRIRNSISMGFILTDPANEILFATDQFAASNTPLVMSAFESKQEKINIGKDSYLLIPVTSIYGFNFIFVEHESVVYNLMTRLRWIFGVALAVCLLMGSSVMSYFTLKNYRAIHSLVTKASEKLGLERDLSGNEYGILLATMDIAAERIDTATMSLRRDRELIRKDALINMLQGTATSDDLSMIDLTEPYQSVAICRIIGRISSSEIRNRRQIAKKILETSIRIINGCTLVEIDETYCIIMGAISALESDITRIHSQTNGIRKQLNSVPGIEVAVSLSALHEGIDSLDLCFTEAQEAMEYRILYGSKGVIEYKKIRDVVSVYTYPAESEKSLSNFIKHGDSISAREITREILLQNIGQQVLSPQIARCLMFELISTVIKTLNEVTLDEHFLNEVKPVDLLVSCETLPQTENAINSIIDAVCERLSDRYKESESRVVTEAQEYIDENFGDVMLNLDLLSDKQGMNSVSLSRKFRDYYGVSVGQYINRKRLDYARLLLSSTEERVSIIATKCGYGSTHTFIRIFKKYEGLTPGQYRAMELN